MLQLQRNSFWETWNKERRCDAGMEQRLLWNGDRIRVVIATNGTVEANNRVPAWPYVADYMQGVDTSWDADSNSTI
jgi:hypothetical protein